MTGGELGLNEGHTSNAKRGEGETKISIGK